jgi:hypothetical protein
MSYDEMKLAFVAGIPDETHGQQIAALIVPLCSQSPEGDALWQRLRRELSNYEVPVTSW